MKRIALAVLILVSATVTAHDGIQRGDVSAGGGAPSFPLQGPGSDCASPNYSWSTDTDAGLCLAGTGRPQMRGDAPGGNESLFEANALTPNLSWDVRNNASTDRIYMIASPGTQKVINWSFSETASATDYFSRWVYDDTGNLNTWFFLRSWTDTSNYEGFNIYMTQSTTQDIYLAAATAGTGANNIGVHVRSAGTEEATVGTGTRYWSCRDDYCRLMAPTGRIHVQSAAFALTESTASHAADIYLGTGLYQGGATFNWSVSADDGTDFQSRRGSTYFAFANDGGTITCATGAVGTSVVAATSGTLTAAVTCTTRAGYAEVNVNATSSLTQTTLDLNYSIYLDGAGGVNPQ